MSWWMIGEAILPKHVAVFQFKRREMIEGKNLLVVLNCSLFFSSSDQAVRMSD